MSRVHYVFQIWNYTFADLSHVKDRKINNESDDIK